MAEPSEKLKAIADRMVAATKSAIARALDPIAARLGSAEARVGALSMIAGRELPAEKLSEVESLLARVKALEARPVGMSYCGVWREDQQYAEGAVVSDHGSAWHCNRLTRSRPGTNSDFTLMVKRGADGKR